MLAAGTLGAVLASVLWLARDLSLPLPPIGDGARVAVGAASLIALIMLAHRPAPSARLTLAAGVALFGVVTGSGVVIGAFVGVALITARAMTDGRPWHHAASYGGFLVPGAAVAVMLDGQANEAVASWSPVLELPLAIAAVVVLLARVTAQRSDLAARTAELASIVAMNRELAQTLDSRLIGDSMARHLALALGMDECGICYWERESDAIVTYGYYPAEARAKIEDVYRLADYPETRRVMTTQQTSVVQIDDPRADPAERAYLESIGGSTLLMVPMVVRGQAVGCVELVSRSSIPLSASAVAVAETMSNEAGTLLENARLYEQVQHEAMHDPLTGLPNRALFRDRLEHALARTTRRGHARIAVMFIDLDNFKRVNDEHGHDIGDEVIRVVAARISRAVRRGDTLARLSGDEFALLLEDIDGRTVSTVARHLLRCLASLIPTRTGEVSISASIGSAVGNAASTNAADILRNADFAMYVAKRGGRGRHSAYDARIRTEADRRARLAADLEHAIERGEIEVAYQPIMDLKMGSIRSVEALARWQHAELGPIDPAEFIPIAEDTGAIIAIGKFVMAEGCRALAHWLRLVPALSLSVNVSARQLDSDTLIDDVRAIVAETGIDSTSVVLELTETCLLPVARAGDVLGRLKEMGFRLAIDDFGSGYASLPVLRDVPVDILKIDRQYVSRAGSAAGDPLISAMIGLARALGLKVIGEGVEREEQHRSLIELGCDDAQGYLLGRPVSQSELSAMLGGAHPPQHAAPAGPGIERHGSDLLAKFRTVPTRTARNATAPQRLTGP